MCAPGCLQDHLRGRWAWRIFGGSGKLDAFAVCRGVEEKPRQFREGRTAEAKVRPRPSRITERAEAMVQGQWGIAVC